MQEGVTSTVIIDDEDPEVMIAYIKLLYDNNVDDESKGNLDYLMHMLLCCSKYQSTQLGEKIQHYAIPHITPNSIEIFLDLSRKYCYPKLEKYCEVYIEILQSYGSVSEISSIVTYHPFEE